MGTENVSFCPISWAAAGIILARPAGSLLFEPAMAMERWGVVDGFVKTTSKKRPYLITSNFYKKMAFMIIN